MENNLKTAEEVLRMVVKHAQHDSGYDMTIEAMQAYASQALEAYRDDLLIGLPNCAAQNLRYKQHIGEYILNTDLTNYIK